MARKAHYTDEKARQIFSKIRAANLQGLKSFAESHHIDSVKEEPEILKSSPPRLSTPAQPIFPKSEEPANDRISTPPKPLISVERSYLREQSTPLQKPSQRDPDFRPSVRPGSVDLSRISDKTAWTPASKDRPPVRFSESEGISEPQSAPPEASKGSQSRPQSQFFTWLKRFAYFILHTIFAWALVSGIIYLAYLAVSTYCDNKVIKILEGQLGIDRRFWMKAYNEHILADLDRADMHSSH